MIIFSNAASDDDSSDAGLTLGNLATPHTTSTMESNVSPSDFTEVCNESFPTVSERNIYVTFPFIGGIAVNEASVNLSLCNVGADYTLSRSTVMAIQDVFVTQRKECVEILVQDLDRLNPGQWLNDNLIEFWFLWLIRNENLDTTDVMMTSTYFYSTLIEKAVHTVDRWFVDDDLFNKKYIIFPINSDNHWSLAVIINPGKISVEFDDTEELEEFPCIVMLD
jgi:Ulp1 family protease